MCSETEQVYEERPLIKLIMLIRRCETIILIFQFQKYYYFLSIVIIYLHQLILSISIQNIDFCFIGAIEFTQMILSK